MKAIRIIERPEGEAPRWILDAWIGLTMKLKIGQNIWLRPAPTKYYVVNAARALSALETADPRAAKWWRDNYPELVGKRKALHFSADCCEVVDTVKPAAQERSSRIQRFRGYDARGHHYNYDAPFETSFMILPD